MTNSPQQGSTPAGWYPDPSGAAESRWWDGQRWTDHTGGAQPAPSAAYSAPPVPAAYGYAAPQRPEVAAGTSIYTPYIWVLVLLPLLSLIVEAIWIPSFTSSLRSQIDQIATNPRSYSPGAFSFVTPLYALTLLSGFVVYGGGVLMAFFDYRELARRGVERPFHWAWTFLYALIYVIGRTVIVRKVAQKRGMTPLWVYIGVFVLSIVLGIVFGVQILSVTLGGLSGLSSLSPS